MRHAQCSCGQLKAECKGEPFRVSTCHCLVCQRRTGSVLGVQVRYRADQVTVTGAWATYSRMSETGRTATYKFCSNCGNTVVWENEGLPGIIALPVGAFADPTFPTPWVSLFESRRAAWLTLVDDGIEHFELGAT